MIIYIAAPYSKGDIGENLHTVFEVADAILMKGHIPYIPHLTHFWHIVSPKPLGFWYKYDLYFLNLCDALIRIPGDSIGADREEARATQLGKTIFHSIDEIPWLTS